MFRSKLVYALFFVVFTLHNVSANEYFFRSSSFVLDLRSDPFISVHPSSQHFISTDFATLNVVAVGSGTLNYQWQVSYNNGNSWTNLHGETSPELYFDYLTNEFDGYKYRVVVSNENGSFTSNSAVLTEIVLSARMDRYANWKKQFQSPNFKNRPLDVNNQQGLSNLMAFAMGLADPTTVEARSLPHITAINSNANEIKIAFQRAKSLEALSLLLEESDDLLEWRPAAIRSTRQITAISENSELVEATLSKNKNSKFYRLAVHSNASALPPMFLEILISML